MKSLLFAVAEQWVWRSLFVFYVTQIVSTGKASFHKYCIVGAGPSGLQLAYQLHRASLDYLVLESGPGVGTFFHKYPRHNTIISINKRYTPELNTEFNLRHDWNSLLSDDASLLFRHYSEKFFPDRSELTRYLHDFHKKLGLRVRFNATVTKAIAVKESHYGTKSTDTAARFQLHDQNGHQYACHVLILATGLSLPVRPKVRHPEKWHFYESMDVDPKQYTGKKVLIVGAGNSAFETASAIQGEASVVQMASRTRVRLAWSTHYVGDLRAVNNGLLDTYQLKSLDAILDWYEY